MSLLSMENISKAFYGKYVLEHVNVELHAGEVHVLAGENGAGKSTLMNILGGIHGDYEGQIVLHGEVCRFASPVAAARRGIAMIHQELSLVPSMSVLDNIFLGREAGRVVVRRGRQEVVARRVLARMGLDVSLETLVGDLPLAVRQLIEIAKALVHDARIIVMDEPTSALGEQDAARLFELIEELRHEGCAIVFISHRLGEVYRVADRITVLRDGRCVGSARAAELPEATLVTWMVGRELSRQFPERNPVFGNERLRVDGVWIRDPSGRARWAVRNVSFAVRAGEVLGIAGLQGSGNSHLFAGLFGAYGRLSRGRLWVEGEEIDVCTPRRAIRHGLALVTNDRKRDGLVLSMSVTANMTRAAFRRFSPLGWVMHERERAAARRQRDAFGVAVDSLTQSVRELSGGNQQKVVLGNWLETAPRVLFLDEPTRGVDVGAKHEIYELMARWTAAGMAIVLITSEMPELLALSDRILVMHRGRAVRELTGQEATQEAVLVAAMGGAADCTRERDHE